MLFSDLRGRTVLDERGRRVGRLRDLIVDLGSSDDAFPVTAVVVGSAAGRHRVLRDVALRPRPGGEDLELVPLPSGPAVRPGTTSQDTEVLVGRDVLDSPVVAQSPIRHGRVADVGLDLGDDGARAVILDLSVGGFARRLLGGRDGVPAAAGAVPISRVHLLSRHGHEAHLHHPGSWVFGLEPGDLAAALTRMPVHQARGVISGADRAVADQVTAQLHPQLRARLTGHGPHPRLSRLRGWRLHRPVGEPTQRSPR